jgi:hypothetical protein
VEVVEYQSGFSAQWDEFVGGSANGTFLHTHKFLSYHGKRFQDRSLIVKSDGEIIAVLPAARALDSDTTIVSHPGSAFGGLVYARDLQGERCIEALRAVCNHLKLAGAKELKLKATPLLYQTFYTQDDIYALFRLDAKKYRSDLSAVLDLNIERSRTKGRKHAFGKSQKAGLKLESGTAAFTKFWPLLTEHLETRFKAAPTHSLAEIQDLASRFPNQIHCHVALKSDSVFAGGVFFQFSGVTRTQYLASSADGQDSGAIDAIIEEQIELSRARSQRYFDFGTSNLNEGKTLNQGLYEFKRSFGAGSLTCDFYQIDLEKF